MKKDLLALEDLDGKSHDEVLSHIAAAFEIKPEELKGVRILVAYESVGSWGCDSSNWFLFRKGRQLFENHGSHCSCYGFEGQWSPEPTTLKYLRSDKFAFCCGGYDADPEGNRQKVKSFLS